ncbi:MAG TPA: Smr/MutS family protein [Thermoanaerobaculia bacterium]|nr:Smr/MutS family protein [Thermoanaerobaculia bacterium]HUM28598.1 Smr/MutS family protein [Thermoanaerobaculia bacterium]HXK66794.1 Smr/MutS family protein [Thermoanaerobaculia bacterium]
MWSGCDLEQVLTLIGTFARTEGGRKGVLSQRTFLSEPEISLRHARIEALIRQGRVSLEGIEENIHMFLRMIPEQGDRLSEKASHEVLLSLDRLSRLHRTFREGPEPDLQKWAGEPFGFEPILEAWLPRFHPEGILRNDAFPELVQLGRRVERAYRELQKSISVVQHSHKDYLQEDTVAFKDERYCLQVKASFQSHVPGLFMGASSSGNTVFIEPMEVVSANNTHRHALEDLRLEKERILGRLLSEIEPFREDLPGALEFLAEVDLYLCFISFMKRAEGILPEQAELREPFSIVQGRHPLIDERFSDLRSDLFAETGRKGWVIPLTMTFKPEHSVLILSGPNGGGKTVALKTTALIAILGRMGWPVPAGPGTRIPFYSDIMIFVGDEQDMLHDLSTFTAAMGRMKTMVDRVDRGTLLFIDEAGFGTDPEEGAALATAILEYIHKSGARAFITTHLMQLKMLALTHTSFVNASMEFDAETLRPTFTFVPGKPGSSHALEIASSTGLRDEVVQRARALLGPEATERDRMLDLLSRMVDEQRARGDMLKRELDRLEEMKIKLKEQILNEKERLRNDLDHWRSDVLKDLEHKIESLRKEGVKVGQKAERKLRNSVLSAPDTLKKSAETIPQFRIGQAVRIRGGKLKGTVRDLTADELLRVEIEGKQVWIPAAEVQTDGGSSAASGTVEYESASEPATNVMVIGMDVEACLDTVDEAIDHALRSGLGSLIIIHGHGTGRLRRAVRDHLKRHRQVSSFRPTSDNGGTEVDL